MSIRKLACGIVFFAAMSAVVDAQAAVPKVKVAGDTITVTVPDGTASGTNRLVLCWGATDAGPEFVDWRNSSILSENVTSTGGVWTVSAAAKGIAANSALRAFIGIPTKWSTTSSPRLAKPVVAGTTPTRRLRSKPALPRRLAFT
jgi:hypothetical protein